MAVIQIIESGRRATKIGKELKFDTNNTISLDYETENIDFSTSI